MDHFQVHAPTQVVFGKNTEAQAGHWCKYYGAQEDMENIYRAAN